MKLLKPILLVGGALLLYTAVRAAKFVNGLSIEFQKISLGGSILSPRVLVTLKIYNPENLSVTISDISGKLLYKNQFLADVRMFESVKINPRETLYLDLQLQSLLPDVFSFLSSVIADRKLNNDFSFDGSLRIDNVPVPYKSRLSW